MEKTSVIILAAGKGTRMKSEIPKVLHPLCSRPMLSYVLDLVSDLKIKDKTVVLGYKHQEVSKFLCPDIKVVVQKRLIGTADAVKQAQPVLKGFKGNVLILYGDIPLLKKETITKLLDFHRKSDFDATILTAEIDKPAGYGRILRDKYSSINGIIEEKDADNFQKEAKEINTGIICFDKDKLFEALKEVKPNNKKKEYYLTDVINILYKKGCLIGNVKIEDVHEAMGINSRLDLAKANKVMQSRINEELMKKGVAIIDPGSTFISYGTKIGQDTTIYPFTVIEKDVKIGKYCSIGPFAHLREASRIGNNVIVGNFLEIVRSNISDKTLLKHFGYIGDSIVGSMVNIGAGTVTANFDGKNKHLTVIKDNAFIGSDTVLVAPVSIGKHAKTGAGSVVLKNNNVADNTLVVGVPARLVGETVNKTRLTRKKEKISLVNR